MAGRIWITILESDPPNWITWSGGKRREMEPQMASWLEYSLTWWPNFELCSHQVAQWQHMVKVRAEDLDLDFWDDLASQDIHATFGQHSHQVSGYWLDHRATHPTSGCTATGLQHECGRSKNQLGILNLGFWGDLGSQDNPPEFLGDCTIEPSVRLRAAQPHGCHMIVGGPKTSQEI